MRVFLIVLDSVGIGEQPDSYKFGDEGSNTIRAISKTEWFDINAMRRIGVFNIDDIGFETPFENPIGAYRKMSRSITRKRYYYWSLGNGRTYFKATFSYIS